MQTNEIISSPRGDKGAIGLDAYIGKTLRLNVKHLPWPTVQAVCARQEAWEPCDSGIESQAQVSIYELEEGCWRADVTQSNLDASRAMGWLELHQLLLVAQRCGCEALELAPENLALPPAHPLPLFVWP